MRAGAAGRQRRPSGSQRRAMRARHRSRRQRHCASRRRDMSALSKGLRRRSASSYRRQASQATFRRRRRSLARRASSAARVPELRALPADDIVSDIDQRLLPTRWNYVGIRRFLGTRRQPLLLVNPQERKPQAQRDWLDLLEGRCRMSMKWTFVHVALYAAYEGGRCLSVRRAAVAARAFLEIKKTAPGLVLSLRVAQLSSRLSLTSSLPAACSNMARRSLTSRCFFFSSGMSKRILPPYIMMRRLPNLRASRML